MSTIRSLLLWLGCVVAAFATTSTTRAQLVDLEPPGARDFVLDRAGMLDESDVTAIRAICDKLLTEYATPILVVTIDSMADHGGRNMRIETFARVLFDQWQIGHATLNEQEWNTGILLLVSKGDRRARIELGAGWGREKDATCQRIMNSQIVPSFKAGDFAGGIRNGVAALDKMARDLELPAAEAPPRPTSHYLVLLLLVGLAVFTAVSLVRRGSSGWAWLMWGAFFGFLGVVLYQMMSQNRGSGGGGFSGGSFGGGFSGGGGASGSW